MNATSTQNDQLRERSWWMTLAHNELGKIDGPLRETALRRWQAIDDGTAADLDGDGVTTTSIGSRCARAEKWHRQGRVQWRPLHEETLRLAADLERPMVPTFPSSFGGRSGGPTPSKQKNVPQTVDGSLITISGVLRTAINIGDPEFLREAVEVFEDRLQEAINPSITALATVIRAKVIVGDAAGADEMADRVDRAIRELEPANSSHAAAFRVVQLASLARAFHAAGRVERAHELYEQAVAAEQIGSPDQVSGPPPLIELRVLLQVDRLPLDAYTDGPHRFRAAEEHARIAAASKDLETTKRMVEVMQSEIEHIVQKTDQANAHVATAKAMSRAGLIEEARAMLESARELSGVVIFSGAMMHAYLEMGEMDKVLQVCMANDAGYNRFEHMMQVADSDQVA